MIIARLNDKLGKIHSFDVPAKKTCPGKTPSCAAVCYASNGRYRTHRVRNRLEASLAFSKKSSFAQAMVALIEAEGADVMRLHSAGDVYSPAYARKWLEIMGALPGVKFYLYTRSWRVPAVRAVLNRMARLPNVRVWWSCDRDSGVPPRSRTPENVRIAYLQSAAGDAPARADLVFRAHRLRRLPAADVPDASGSAVKVCPTETGLPDAKSVTCRSCGYCWQPPGDPSRGARVALPVL